MSRSLPNRPPPPSQLTASPRTLSSFAAQYGLSLLGPDRMVSGFGGTTTRLSNRSELLCWASAPAYVEAFVDSDLGACLTGEWGRDAIPEGRSALLTDNDPTEVYYALFSDSVNSGEWTTITAHRGQRTTVASTATIHDNVSIGDDCVIMDHVVILPQSYVGDRVIIKPNTTVGGNGFQVGVIRGKRQLIPHAGGVVIGTDVTIGSSCCVDRGLFGEMSSIGDRTHVDNLVQVAHSDTIGRDTTIAACAEISGSVSIGDGVWLAPQCAITHGVAVGDHSMVGIGSVVVRDVPAHAIAVGVPARVTGWQCVCGTRLTKAESELTRCTTCGRGFDFSGGEPILVDDGPAQASV